ncbi:MAG TPA: glycosyltransferase, partial [Caulobacteraceae bacterium]
AGNGRHGFRVDLSKLLRYGPHEVIIRAAGAAEPLPGGRFRTGVFAADGEVDCPGYLDRPEDTALLARAPFEHQARAALRMEPSRLVPRLINRLRRERVTFAETGPPALLLALAGGDETLQEAWGLQSYPAATMLDAGADVQAIRAAAAEAGWVFFAMPGEVLHPSAAGIVSGIADADVAAWPRFCADAPRAGSPGTLLRRPQFDPVTARHGALSDSCLAVRGPVLAEAPDGVLLALAEGRPHPLWVWLADRNLRWRSHPEALTSSVGDWTPPSRAEIERDEGLCRELLADSNFTVQRTAADLPTPRVLVPERRAAKTSVLIPFRGRPELTLRCVHALAGQRLSGELELVLIDNQSEPEDAERVFDGARRMLGAERVVALSYDAPFNHSAENNLAARAAGGEVLVICNNDVTLEDPALIEQLGAWALQPGIATVGCRLEDPGRGLGSYGHIFAPPSDDPFQPPLRENPDPAYGRFVHAVPGNTLALAAIRRELYLDLGGLDETRFPIGYNDVDFMLRASRQGLLHLYLGHVAAGHRRGSSRTGDDEDLQALSINQAYPEVAQGHLHQLARVRIGPTSPAPPSLEAEPSPEDAALIARLEALAARHAAEEQRRADLAEAFARAQGLIAKLEAELDGVRALGGKAAD